MQKNWSNKILTISNGKEFENLAIEAFYHQYHNIEVYHDYCSKLGIDAKTINSINDIPFLPIEFFKTHNVVVKEPKPTHTFTSSGTTGMQTSMHKVVDIDLYEKSFLSAFKLYYGDINDYCVIALLPSYIERGGSSLVYMANKLIELSKNKESGFYLENYVELSTKLNQITQTNKKVLLLGVTYALLDMAEQFPQKLPNTIIMETGGMKGKRKEVIREELHSILMDAFSVPSIHSEYGMTELLSQAYSAGKGIFKTPNWLKILIRDTYDPFCYLDQGRSGGINIIDLANINSCCFIETKDIGKTLPDDSFTILGRFDNSDIRGCNLMVS